MSMHHVVRSKSQRLLRSGYVSCFVLLFSTGCSSGSDGAARGGTNESIQDASVDQLDATKDVEQPDADARDASPACQEAAPPGQRVGPSGYGLDGWTWHDGGAVLELKDAASLDGFLAPCMVATEHSLHLWATKKTGLIHRIVYTVSQDGKQFEPWSPITGLGDGDVIAYPSVLRSKRGWTMWFASGSIDRAESSDGIHWHVTHERVLTAGEPGQFDSLTVLYPYVVRDASGGYVMFYTGYDGTDFAIGEATSSDGVTWVKKGTVLKKGASDSFYNRSVAQASAWLGDGQRLLWFGGYDTSKTDPGPFRIGLARSLEAGRFEVLGVAIDLSESGLKAHGTRGPSVVRWQGRWWMAYSGLGEDNRYRILTAWSETCP